MNIVGRTIIRLRALTQEELDMEFWSTRLPVTAVEFDDGTILYAARDEEGNGPGSLYLRKGSQSWYLHVSFS